MKTFLFRLLILIFATFASQYLVYALIKTTLDQKTQFRLTRFFKSKKHGYFVLGNSRAVNSVNEKYANEILKYDLMNLAFNGEPYLNILDMLNDINGSNKNAVIFIEITGLASDEPDNGYSYYMSNSSFIRKHYSATIYDRIHLLRFNNEFFLRNLYYLKKSDNDWINRTTITANIIEDANSSPPFLVIKKKTEFLNRLIEMNKIGSKNNNKIIYFLAPYLPQYLSKASDYAEVKGIMCDKKNNLNFIDLNSIKLQQDMYSDRMHTNLKGSTLLTDGLITLSKEFN